MNDMQKRFLCFVFVVFAHFTISAQFSQEVIDENSSFKDRLFTGGGMGLGFGNIDWVNISPVLGYRISDKTSVGAGATYRYTNYKVFRPNIRVRDYGANLFARHLISAPVFLHVEYEHLNFEFPVGGGETVRLNFNSFLGGAGIAHPIGRRSSVILMALYNFSFENANESPYDRPWVIRGGINFGI